jgi:hypothetical protein
MSILTPSNLETLNYKAILWETIVNKNFSIIDYRLQKVVRLPDVDVPSKKQKDGALLMWSGSKWVAAKVVT